VLGHNGYFATSCAAMSNYDTTPDNLPVPLDDGAAAHLLGLSLPAFKALGKTFLKRLTVVAHHGVIQNVHYPIFPSDSDAAWVLDHLKAAS